MLLFDRFGLNVMTGALTLFVFDFEICVTALFIAAVVRWSSMRGNEFNATGIVASNSRWQKLDSLSLSENRKTRRKREISTKCHNKWRWLHIQIHTSMLWCRITNGRWWMCASGSSYATEWPPLDTPLVSKWPLRFCNDLHGQKFCIFRLCLQIENWKNIYNYSNPFPIFCASHSKYNEIANRINISIRSSNDWWQLFFVFSSSPIQFENSVPSRAEEWVLISISSNTSWLDFFLNLICCSYL